MPLLLAGCSGVGSDGNTGFVPASINLPVLRLTTTAAAPIVSKDVYLDGHMTLTSTGSSPTVVDSDLTVKGHGNSTWVLPKKPYKIKLTTKQSLLGMPADKEWILLANYDDKSLIRNDVAFELSRRLGMVYTTRSAFLELYVNGQYEGNYQLTEEIKIANNRVDINEMDATDISGKSLTGGYLAQADHDAEPTDTNFTIAGSTIPITLTDPSPPAPQQLTYFSDYLATFNSVLLSPTFADPSVGYAEYINTDSFIDWYLANEIFKNNDAVLYNSCYMYKDKNAVLFMGPVWDFDIGAGNVNYNGNQDPTGWWIRTGPWYTQLFQDPAFRAKVKARWQALKATQFDTLPAYIDQEAAALDLSQQNNFARWPILNTYVSPNSEVAGSYPGEISFLKSWLTTRISWMDQQINSSSF